MGAVTPEYNSKMVNCKLGHEIREMQHPACHDHETKTI